MKAPPTKQPTAIPVIVPADRDGFEPFELLVVIVVEAIFEVEVENGATPVSVVEVIFGVEDKKDSKHLWCRYRDSRHPGPARKEDS
jgi:hypothetical protein